jgi:hypothetical protein
MQLEERLLARIVKRRGCWAWTGGTTHDGYPLIWAGEYTANGNPRMSYAHRIAYELWVGPIPKGWQVDHTCRKIECLRPAHLEAVTPAENLRRRRSANGAKTHCKHGHPFSKANTYISIRPNGRRLRQCRTCVRDAQRAAYVRKG